MEKEFDNKQFDNVKIKFKKAFSKPFNINYTIYDLLYSDITGIFVNPINLNLINKVDMNESNIYIKVSKILKYYLNLPLKIDNNILLKTKYNIYEIKMLKYLHQKVQNMEIFLDDILIL